MTHRFLVLRHHVLELVIGSVHHLGDLSHLFNELFLLLTGRPLFRTHCILPSLFFQEMFELFLVPLVGLVLVFKLNLSVVDLGLQLHQFVKGPQDVDERGVLLIEVIRCILDRLDVQKIEADPSENVVYLLQVFVFCGDDHLLIQVVDTDDVADHVLKSGLEPINPRPIQLLLQYVVVIPVHHSHMAVQVR